MSAEDRTKEDYSAAMLQGAARRLVQAARDRGFVLTISLEPKLPLAMGHHESVIELRPVRVRDDS